MKKFEMDDAREFASKLIKIMLIKHGKLNLEYVQGINEMLAFLDGLPEEDEA